MKVKSEHILIVISEAEREKLFTKVIKRIDGSEVKLVTGLRADKGEEASYSQSVSVGEVVAVGSGVDDIRVGDIAIMDYVVDINDDSVVHADSLGKVVSVRAVTTYKKYDLIIDANRRVPHPTIVHKVGDVDEFSLVIGVVRDGDIIPVAPYLFCEYVAEDKGWSLNEGSGLYTISRVDNIVERVVTFAHKNSEIKAGDVICAEVNAIFDRKLENKRFDIILSQDVFALISE